MSKIKLDREKCIGCGSCQAACPKCFELIEDGKSHLKGSTLIGQIEELETDDVGCGSSASEVCPAQCIAIEK